MDMEAVAEQVFTALADPTRRAILAALPSEDLAARADDVRQVGHAVVAQLTAGSAVPPPDGDFILVGREVDPADLIRLADTVIGVAVGLAAAWLVASALRAAASWSDSCRRLA